jgi:hypothetical protein
VLEWVDKVSKWPIKRIIPCHFANDIKASSKDFRRAFDFLIEKKVRSNPYPKDADCKVLIEASQTLTESGVLFPEAPLVKL